MLLSLLAVCAAPSYAAPSYAEDPVSAPTPSPRKLADQDEGKIFFSAADDDIFSLHPRVLLLPLRVQGAFEHCAFAYATDIYRHPTRGLAMTWNDFADFMPQSQKPIGVPPTPYIAALSEALSTIETGDYTPLGEFCPNDLADFEEYDGI